MRLVLDTNILISALISKQAAPYELYQLWRSGIFELITSREQLDELERVMTYPKLKRYFSPAEAQAMLMGVATYATIASSLPTINDSRDAADNIILATAIAGKAKYIASGDKSDLLSLGKVRNIPIITARKAVDILQSSNQ